MESYTKLLTTYPIISLNIFSTKGQNFYISYLRRDPILRRTNAQNTIVFELACSRRSDSGEQVNSYAFPPHFPL